MPVAVKTWETRYDIEIENQEIENQHNNSMTKEEDNPIPKKQEVIQMKQSEIDSESSKSESSGSEEEIKLPPKKKYKVPQKKKTLQKKKKSSKGKSSSSESETPFTNQSELWRVSLMRDIENIRENRPYITEKISQTDLVSLKLPQQQIVNFKPVTIKFDSELSEFSKEK